jgi:tetratricopeptide (TPR) repeat protein
MDSAAALLEKTGHYAEAIAFLDPLVRSTPWEAAFRLRLAKAQILAGTDRSAGRDSLGKIAAAPENPYSQRVEAALALSGSGIFTDFGSVELKLLAGDFKSITFGAADQPFFYEARLRAARSSTDARQRVQILTKALEDIPSRDDARVPLFYAASSLHSDEFAMASIEPILRDQRFRPLVPRNADDEEEIFNSSEDSKEQVRGTAPAYGSMKLQPAQEAQFYRSVGVVLMRLDRFAEALAYLQAAQKLEKNPAQRKEIAGDIADVRASLRREQVNTARQPILHADLEQDRLVRPRLVARPMPLAKQASKAGEKP